MDMEDALRCGRNYNNIDFQQTPDKTSPVKPNGEHIYFDIHVRCKICGTTGMKQRQSAVECLRFIQVYRIRHSTCHLKAVIPGKKRRMYRYG